MPSFETRGLATALLRTRPNWWQLRLGHERQPRPEEPALQRRRLEGRPQASSGWRRSSQGAWLKLHGFHLAHHGCPHSVIAGIHGQHLATSCFRASVSIMDAQFRRETSMGAEPCRQAWLGCEGEAALRQADATRRRGALSLSTAFAPACGHMTDRGRYRDSPATRPPSESRGDIRYLLCLREIVPRIHPLTPAFRGSFRFEHYPLTGAAESS